ncbi:MAG: hypothetical protein KF862_10025 [Chitinophagaceae bacterium]|nr:hypothetical protein [Chitinophagaceae bacterium]
MTKKDVLVQTPQLPHANVGQHIGFEKGAKMIKDFYDLHGENSCHFVGRNILEKLLSQPDCVGINIYKALNDRGAQTYVFIGVDSTGKAILEYTYVNDNGELDKVPGIVANYFSPRPGWWSWSF